MVKRHPVVMSLILTLVVAGLLFFILNPSQAVSAGKAEKAEKKAAPAQKEQEKRLPVEVSQAKTGSISSFLMTTSTLDPDRQVTVVAETNGIVDKLLVDEGNFVREGQILATIHEAEKQVAFHKAQIRIENAARELERKESSFEQQIISKQEYDKAKYEMEVARAEKNEAQVNVDRTVIRAPFAGLITARFIEKGQNISQQTQLFTLVDVDPLEAKIYLPEKEVQGIRQNQIVSLALNARKDITFSGSVRQINPAVDTKTGTIKVTVEVTKAPSTVRPGSFVDVRLETQRHDKAVLIPKRALLEDSGERFVYVVEKDRAVRRNITVGFLDETDAEILSGVDAGEVVVISGQGSLRDGAKTDIIAKK